jgi:hypothetical protein
MHVRARTLVSLAAVLAATSPRVTAAQLTRTLTTCTPDALAICAELRLTATAGIFEIGLRTVGATGVPALPIAVYNLVLGTGAPAALAPLSTNLVSAGVGGATVSDPTPWEVFDAGDVLFLSALSNRGVGGCVAGADVAGFGQAVRTCGAGSFAAFQFAPTAAFNPNAFTILNLEAVVLAAGLPAASCGAAGAECVITADTLVPEPATALLVGVGLLTTVAGAIRHRRV